MTIYDEIQGKQKARKNRKGKERIAANSVEKGKTLLLIQFLREKREKSQRIGAQMKKKRDSGIKK